MATSVPSVPWRGSAAASGPLTQAPRASVQDRGGGVLIANAQELDDYLKSGSATKSGAVVNSNTALRSGPVFACVRIIAGPTATLPLHIKRRVDDRTRKDESGSDLWQLLNRRPNRWQKPHQFKRMLTAHVLLRGNAVCMKVVSRGAVRELIPLHPDRVEISQKDDLSLNYRYTKPSGGVLNLRQDEVFHLFGMTLNGYSGVTPIIERDLRDLRRGNGFIRHPREVVDGEYP